MTTPILSRRGFVVQTAAAAATAVVAGPAPAAERAGAASVQASPLNVVCVGAHPDDPECGCGGTLARYIEAGHRVTIMYLTRGEGGIAGKSNEETAAIRTAEAEAACKILGAKPLFAGQVGNHTEVTRRSKDTFYELIMAEKPNIVFGQWPIDTHSEHAAGAMLTIRAVLPHSRAVPQQGVSALLLRGRRRRADVQFHADRLRGHYLHAGEEEGGPVRPQEHEHRGLLQGLPPADGRIPRPRIERRRRRGLYAHGSRPRQGIAGAVVGILKRLSRICLQIA